MAEKMQSMKFVGWVEKILPADNYSREFVVRDYRDDNDPDKPKFPNAFTFKASVANGASLQLDDVEEGDKVAVTFFLTGRSGLARTSGKYYHINTLNIAKDKGVVVLEKVVKPESEQKQEEPEDDDQGLPF